MIIIVFIVWLPLQIVILFYKQLLRFVKKPVPELKTNSFSGVSVMILNWNGDKFLKRNLSASLSLMQKYCKTNWEILVVDNGSEDGSVKYLESVKHKNFKLVKLDKNYFFSGGNNRGLNKCKYSHVLMMNNDVLPKGDFITPLIEAFKKDKKTFAVAGQLFFPGGKVRLESGHTQMIFEKKIFLGHNLNEPNFFSTVAWPGGGFTLFDKSKLKFLGGFNEMYSPFYYEDTDLGMRAWALGWPSFYEPRSQAIHAHKQSVSKLDPIYVANIIETNRYKFFLTRFNSWKAICSVCVSVCFDSKENTVKNILKLYLKVPQLFKDINKNNYSPVYTDLQIEKFSKHFAFYKYSKYSSWILNKLVSKPNVLFVSAYPPIPAHGGGVRVYNHLKHIAPYCKIFLLTFSNMKLSKKEEDFFNGYVQKYELLKLVERRHRFMLPYYFSEFWSRDARTRIMEYLDQNDFDAVNFEFTQIAHLMPEGLERLNKTITELDVTFISFFRRYKASGKLALISGLGEIANIFHYEKKYLARFDTVVAVSEVDRTILMKMVPGKKIKMIPNGVDTDYYKRSNVYSTKNTSNLMFIGSWMHPPNRQAIDYYIHDILPKIKSVDFFGLSIVGEVGSSIDMHKVNGVKYLGFVDDTRKVYEKTRIFIAPVISGSGTRIKILEAMSMGVPVVATKIGAKGLALDGSKQVVVCKDAGEFARTLEKLYGDPKKLISMSVNGRELVLKNYSWKSNIKKYLEIYGT